MKEKLYKTIYALEVSVFNTNENFDCVKEYYQTNEPVQIIEKAQFFNPDILGLKFNISDNSQIPEAVTLLKKLLPYVKLPLMIRGVNNDSIDRELIPALTNSLDRESIIAFADEGTYKEIVPAVIKGNHNLVIRTPIDINLAKEMNILTSDLGLSLDKILIDTDIGGLGYGLEYGYSIIEKISLENDEYLNMPIISFAGEESLKTKEAKSDNFSESWGDIKTRAVMFEIAAASAVKAAGASLIVLNHPETLKSMRYLV